ncbi:membrane protein [Beggiatoa sp. PS]|nr:membrane protein [Beggiatoa sp. PS]
MSENPEFRALTVKDIAKEIAKKYALFFWIAATFLIISGIYLKMQPEEFGVKLIAEKTTQLSILMLGIAFFYLLLDALVLKIRLAQKNLNPDVAEEEPKKKKGDFAGALTRLLIGSFGASTIPTGISLALCAFKGMEYISYLSGVEIYIAFAGITLMSIAALSIYEEKTRMEDEVKKLESLDNLLSTSEPSD